MMPARPTPQLLTGWGATSATLASVVRPTSDTAVMEHVATSPGQCVARGLGRSYGDAAQLAGGTVLDMTSLQAFSLDTDSGVLRCQAGASLDAIIRACVPRGWFVPVTPGTRFVTIGGAIAADVHGKNHHGAGSFGQHVHRMQLVTADGQSRWLTDSDQAFWATVGGMGQTGVITAAEVQMIPVRSGSVVVDTRSYRELDDLAAAMIRADADYDYTVAWVDATSRSLRSVLTLGNHHDQDGPVEFPRRMMTVPRWTPRVVNGASARLFNELWYRKAPKRRDGQIMPLHSFFHPLDGVADWNRLYGRSGFLQYQFVVPESAFDVLPMVLHQLRGIGAASAMTVLKRFGPGNRAPLSFPMAGWTLTVDVSVTTPGLSRALSQLDSVVLAAGGRHYLAKDSRMAAEVLAAGYPEFGTWDKLRAELDPEGRFRSDLFRRLSRET